MVVDLRLSKGDDHMPYRVLGSLCKSRHEILL
jgi:hypothetical protein